MTARSVSLTIALCIFCVGCASSRHELWSCDECRFHDVVTAAANAAMDSGAEIANVTESTDPHCVKLLLVWGMKNLTPESPILRVEISAENSQVCVRVSDDIVAPTAPHVDRTSRFRPAV